MDERFGRLRRIIKNSNKRRVFLKWKDLLQQKTHYGDLLSHRKDFQKRSDRQSGLIIQHTEEFRPHFLYLRCSRVKLLHRLRGPIEFLPHKAQRRRHLNCKNFSLNISLSASFALLFPKDDREKWEQLEQFSRAVLPSLLHHYWFHELRHIVHPFS